ncbi:hypothetical protein QTP70_015709 [Hemibagrus guttatus]|uniref:Serine/threonine-protein kinase 1 n=1 Tax=Hemibagrus guttatus TaxID=175788 RepID=A0AAE0UHA9_9TELE|nr:hypothetical protein QTP70_015709 [Hemibagrus guttatus]
MKISQTVQLTLHIGHHTELITLYVTKVPEISFILGFPWLQLHNHRIDWSIWSISIWRPQCPQSCLRGSRTKPPTIEESVDLARVVEDYWDLQTVFSKHRAQTLPPHRPFDCVINLLPGAAPPRGRLFSLSSPEQRAPEDDCQVYGCMDEYIQEALSLGFICPSTSPASTGFFFVKKKDGSLCPCIDYHGLNTITQKDRYPLPLINWAFDCLQQTKGKVDMAQSLELFVLVMERPDPCMDLYEFYKLSNGQLCEDVPQTIMEQMVQAARHYCDHGVLHHDFKPENVLINQQTLEVKLIEFGCGDLLTDNVYTENSGQFTVDTESGSGCCGEWCFVTRSALSLFSHLSTPYYNPSEWILYQEYFGISATVWSLGVLLYELVCGILPFNTREKIVQRKLKFPCHLMMRKSTNGP